MDNLPEFLAQIDRIEAVIPEIHRDAQVALLVAGYEFAIGGTPVVTGALRAENIVVEGDPIGAARPIYESPNRPGPDALMTVVGGELQPPNVGDAKVAASDVDPFGILGVLNQRFYASFAHDGTASQSPQPWMDLARDHVEALASRLRIDDSRLR